MLHKPTDDITQEYVEGFGIEYDKEGNAVKQHKIRVMSPLEIKQRLEQNQANTASALRARVVAYNVKSNGHSGR